MQLQGSASVATVQPAQRLYSKEDEKKEFVSALKQIQTTLNSHIATVGSRRGGARGDQGSIERAVRKAQNGEALLAAARELDLLLGGKNPLRRLSQEAGKVIIEVVGKENRAASTIRRAIVNGI